MIVAAAVCPHPPLLARELTGRQDAAAELRAACLEVVTALVATRPEVVVVVGGADRSGPHPVPIRTRFDEYGGGLAGRGAPDPVPLSVRIGCRLLHDAGSTVPAELVTVAWDAPARDVEELGRILARRPERIALLVLGDGSARRGELAPGYLDERAFDLDAEIARALTDGDAAALRRLDPGLAAELMVGGRAAFQVLAAAVSAQPGQVRARMRYRDDPFGVMYFVALWQLDGKLSGGR